MTVRSLQEKDIGNSGASVIWPRNILILLLGQYLFRDTGGSVCITLYNFVEIKNG